MPGHVLGTNEFCEHLLMQSTKCFNKESLNTEFKIFMISILNTKFIFRKFNPPKIPSSIKILVQPVNYKKLPYTSFFVKQKQT